MIPPVTEYNYSMPIYKEAARHFFRKWSSDMAYVLGFFAADGCMNRNKRGAHFISFQVTDLQILRDIRAILKSNHKLYSRQRNKKWKRSYQLQIGSKNMFNDLVHLGFSPAKSKTLSFPDIPGKYICDFVRGYFDGDGNVYFKKHWAKDRGKLRWVFTTRFTSGSKGFLISLHKVLRRYDVSGGFILEKNRGYELVFSHHDSLALFRLMYNNVPDSVFLKRKYRLFKRALVTLYGKNAAVV